jgi:outer membrane protein TolC
LRVTGAALTAKITIATAEQQQSVPRYGAVVLRIVKERYAAGSSDLLTLLIVQNEQLASQSDLVKLQNAQLANRINLHLAVGGSFDAKPAANP